MTPASVVDHTSGNRAQLVHCLLLAPVATGASGDQGQFAKEPGCVKDRAIKAGGRMRAELDRQSAAYRAIDRQRTAAERINRQAWASSGRAGASTPQYGRLTPPPPR